MQIKAYSDAVRRYKYKTKYMMFLDIDEFVVLKNPKDQLFDKIETMLSGKHIGGVALSWLMFGSNGHKHKPKGLVIENYTRRADKKFMLNVKTIGNPRFMTLFLNPHYPIYKYGLNNVNEKGGKVVASLDYNKSTESMWINHYFTKSEEECMAKIAKGIATVGIARTAAIFKERDKNDFYDDTILRYVKNLKSNIGTT